MPNAARTRITRLLYISLSVAALVYSVLGWPKVQAQLADLPAWWGWTTYVVDTASPLLLGLLALLRGPQRLLRTVAAVYAGAFLLTMVTWRAELLTSHDPGGASPWTNDIVTVAVVAVAIAFPARWAWSYLLVATVLVGVVRLQADPELGAPLAGADLLYASLTNVVFVSLTVLTRSGARRLDEAASRAGEEAAAEAAASARAQERVRINALAHDHVLAVLLVASRVDTVPTAQLQQMAALGLRALDEPVALTGDTVPLSELVNMVRAAITSQSDGIRFDVEVGRDRAVPARAAHALLEATGEALRNSLRHAGAGSDRRVSRAVSFAADDREVRVTVSDDGRGFSARRVPVQRLGLRVSIVERMHTVPGGFAEVETAPDAGTTIGIGWRGP